MPIFCTRIKVLNQKTKKLVWIDGLTIDAPSYELALEMIEVEGWFYLEITGELIMEYPEKENGDPDLDNPIDFRKISMN